MRNFKCPKKINAESLSDDELGIHRNDEEDEEEDEEENDETPDEEPDDDGEEQEDDDDDNEDEDEDVDDDDTSSEAWSLINDMSIVPYRPVLTSSDESQSGSGAYFTPPTTMEVDNTEPMEFSTTVGHVRSEPSRNVARRQRARRPGVFTYRRGRWRQPISEQEHVRLTPFAQGITFNGFARNYDPIEVLGYTFDWLDGIMYKVNWRQDSQPWRPIESSLMRTYRPSMVIDYYEAEVKKSQHRNYYI